MKFIDILEQVLLADVKVVDIDSQVVALHLILGSENQLYLLWKTSTWYLDGTFKYAREPFKQLFAIYIHTYTLTLLSLYIVLLLFL